MIPQAVNDLVAVGRRYLGGVLATGDATLQAAQAIGPGHFEGAQVALRGAFELVPVDFSKLRATLYDVEESVRILRWTSARSAPDEFLDRRSVLVRSFERLTDELRKIETVPSRREDVTRALGWSARSEQDLATLVRAWEAIANR